MTALFPDTTPEAERFLVELLRRASIERKLEMLDHMNRTARDLALMGLRARHPNATDAQLQRHLAGLLLGPEFATRVYGPLQPNSPHTD
jgi:hypothetical protein